MNENNNAQNEQEGEQSPLAILGEGQFNPVLHEDTVWNAISSVEQACPFDVESSEDNEESESEDEEDFSDDGKAQDIEVEIEEVTPKGKRFDIDLVEPNAPTKRSRTELNEIPDLALFFRRFRLRDQQQLDMCNAHIATVKARMGLGVAMQRLRRIQEEKEQNSKKKKSSKN